MARVTDNLPEGEYDPLADDPPPVVEAAVVEAPPAPVVEPEAPAPIAEPALDQEEALPDPATEEEMTYKKRWQQGQEGWRQATNERNDLQRQRDEALALAQQVYQQSMASAQPAAPSVPEITQDERTQAAELGITEEQLVFMKQLADSRASEQVGVVQTQWQQQQEQLQQQAYEQALASQRMGTVNAFRAAHQVTPEMEEDIFAVLREVDMVDERNQFVQSELRMDHLEVAFEAAQDPYLRDVLRANPQYYDTDAGMDYARRQASRAKRDDAIDAQLRQTTSSPSTLADSEAAVAAAETLPASGGSPPSPGGPPRDEFDEAVAYDHSKRKSVFSQ